MAQDSNEGIAYLMALKHSPGSSASVAPAQDTKPEAAVPHKHNQPPLAERYAGAEKRRSQRYKCTGSAEVRERGSEVRTWTTFTDISLHGCYVEAQSIYPVGTPLQMKLEANDIRVDIHGKVRVAYPSLGMGIAFEDKSDDTTQQLRKLLVTITRPCVIMGPGVASSLPAAEPLSGVPLLKDPTAAIQALLEFFENRQMLMREDFVRILKTSQK